MSDGEQYDYSDIIETLEQLEQTLIEYEDSLDSGGVDNSQIHILFRYAHNLKSSLGMARKQHCSDLTHSVENNFDLIRSGAMEGSRELIDASLDAVDLIKANLFRDEEAAEELIALKSDLDALKDRGTSAEQKGSINFLLTDEQKAKVAEKAASGESIYLVEKLIKTDISKKDYESLPIYDDIREIGTLIALHPPFEEINTKSEESIVSILFSTSMTEEELYYEIFDPMHKIDFTDAIPAAVSDTASKPAAEVTESPEPAAASEQSEQRRFLIVEDDFTTRHLELNILREFGSCEVAVDGNEAVAAFERNLLENSQYDCIFLDIIIPGIDGHEVLKRIRDFEADRNIFGFDRTKIIIVSNLRDMENISRSFRAQSDSYIVKPFTKKKVERELSRLNLL